MTRHDTNKTNIFIKHNEKNAISRQSLSSADIMIKLSHLAALVQIVKMTGKFLNDFTYRHVYVFHKCRCKNRNIYNEYNSYMLLSNVKHHTLITTIITHNYTASEFFSQTLSNIVQTDIHDISYAAVT